MPYLLCLASLIRGAGHRKNKIMTYLEEMGYKDDEDYKDGVAVCETDEDNIPY